MSTDAGRSAAPRIGLALSGGGFRATAFGLGALRALHDRGVLDQISVVSGISGGSLLTAMWAYGPDHFDEFDAAVVELLRTGLQRELIMRSLTPRRAAANLANGVRALPPGRLKRNRYSTRTESLVDALRAHGLSDKTMADVTHPGLNTIICATDLSTGNAVRFGSHVSSCSPHGTIKESVPVVDAVAASAAFPALLPHLLRSYNFSRADGTTHRKVMLMTDGGVYDNLGLSPLLPGRSPAHTAHVYDLDYLIAVDAGVGRTAPRSPNFWPGRMKRSFEIAHGQAQNAMRSRIHDLERTGRIKFVYSYLGTSDTRLPIARPDLVTRAQVMDYPTNFAPVSQSDLQQLAGRGEQVTRMLLNFYCPELGL